MKTYSLANSNLNVSSVILGLMRIGQMSDADIRKLVDTALSAGINMVDHADVYGQPLHHCESRFAQAMQFSPADRAKIVIQSKAGIRKGYFDFSESHLLEAVDGSLLALKTSRERYRQCTPVWHRVRSLDLFWRWECINVH